MKKLCLSAACLIALVGSAAAQVVTPPPKPAPETPEFTVPEPKPAIPKITAGPNRVNPQVNTSSLRGELPAIPYTKLARLDENGKIVHYDVLLDYEALRSNPVVGESKSIEMRPLLIGRRFRMETIVIDNLDLMEKVDHGLLNDMGLSDMAKMKQIIDTITPLVPPKSVTQEMFDRGMLSPLQHRFNLKILGEYQNDILNELTIDDPKAGLSAFMKYMMHESLKEAQQAYDGMLGEAVWRMPVVLEHAGLSGTPQAARLSEFTGNIEDGPEAMVANAVLMRQAWDGWDLSQKQSFLRAVQDTRVDPHQPPVARVDLSNPTLKDETGSGQFTVTSQGSKTPPKKKPAEGGQGAGGGGGD